MTELQSETKTTETTTIKSFTKTGLLDGEDYRFQIQSRNLAGWSQFSSEIIIRTSKAPDAPINLVIDQKESSELYVTLKWEKGASDGDSPVTSFNIFFDDGATGDWVLTFRNVRELEEEFSLDDFSKTYKFAVTAISASGESAKSQDISINFDDVIEERRQWCFNEDLLKTLNKNYAPEIDEEALAILEKCIDFYGKNLIDINKIAVQTDANALMMASFYGYLKTLDKLIELNADLDYQTMVVNKYSAMIFPLRNTDFVSQEAVIKLINANANVNLLAKNDYDALIYASKDGYADIVRLLLKKGANYSQQTTQGLTALMLASYNGHTDVVYQLVDVIGSGAALNIQQTEGEAAIHYATMQNHIEIVKQLLYVRCDIDLQNHLGQTALYIAAQKGYSELVSLLLDKGADVNIPDTQNVTPLIVASKIGRIDIIENLLDYDANANALSTIGAFALQQCVTENHPEAMKVLLRQEYKAQVDINLQNPEGNTALMIAVEINNVEAVEILLFENADLSIQNEFSNNAYQIALNQNNQAILTLLEDAGANEAFGGV